jgi:hypothetical protein
MKKDSMTEPEIEHASSLPIIEQLYSSPFFAFTNMNKYTDFYSKDVLYDVYQRYAVSNTYHICAHQTWAYTKDCSQLQYDH